MMLYSCTHMATVDVKGLTDGIVSSSPTASSAYRAYAIQYNTIQYNVGI